MTTAKLKISGPEQAWTIPLDPKGVLIGRSPRCDAVLGSRRVSRIHARLFQDPFGRWVIEDVGSRNGVWMNDKRVEACVLLPGERIQIEPFTLSIEDTREQQIEADPAVESSSTVIDDDPDTAVLPGVEGKGGLLRIDLKRLNAIGDRLATLTSADQLYSMACRLLAGNRDIVVAALRLPVASVPLPRSPQILALCFGREAEERKDRQDMNVHLSRRVLETVRATGEAVMGSNVMLSGQELTLTVVDSLRPRAVCCAPIAVGSEAIDALYVDMPSDEAETSSVDFMQAVAQQVGFARRSLLLAEANAERQALDHQLAVAREIQSRLVPEAVGDVPGTEVAIRYQPAMWVGGDFVESITMRDGRLAFAVGDVTGKGLPAALLMSSLHSAFRSAMAFCTAPAQAMEHIDWLFRGNLPPTMFVTLFVGMFDPHSGVLKYVNAGHIPPAMVGLSAGGSLDLAENSPVGVHEGAFTPARHTLAPGSGLVVVTDGITETMSPQGELFGRQRLEDLAGEVPTDSAENVANSVIKAAADFREALHQQDDITVFVLLYRGCGASGPA